MNNALLRLWLTGRIRSNSSLCRFLPLLDSSTSRLQAVVILIACSVFLVIWTLNPNAAFNLSAFVAEPIHSGPARSISLYQEVLVTNAETPSVHAATAYASGENDLVAFWYGGTREGASDVSLYSSRYDGKNWSNPWLAIDRREIQTASLRHVRKIGNPVVHKFATGEVWLFFVTVSVGGWAGSAINLVTSIDDGQSWSKPKRLVTSPFLNISTLVKGPAFNFADGAIGLPVYHEFLGKFSELLKVDRHMNVVSKTRLSSGRFSLQPVILPTSPEHAVGFMRYAGESPRRILRFEGDGRLWSSAQKIHLPNPNAAISVINLGKENLLMAFNNTDQGRHDLSLAYSEDQGRSWKVIVSLESAGEATDAEYSYPWLMRSGNGNYHLLYTWHKTHIKHITFNDGWLRSQISRAGA